MLCKSFRLNGYHQLFLKEALAETIDLILLLLLKN